MFALSDPSSCFAARRVLITIVASLPENFEYHCRQGFRRGRCHPMQLHRYSNDLFCAGRGQKMAKKLHLQERALERAKIYWRASPCECTTLGTFGAKVILSESESLDS